MSSKQIVHQILADIERYGKLPWEAGWLSRHINGITKIPYRGCNILSLSSAMHYGKYNLPIWLTFNQVNRLGGSVKAGSKGVMVYFFKAIEINQSSSKEEKEEIEVVEENNTLQTPQLKHEYVMRTYYVFNIDQTTLKPSDLGIETASFIRDNNDAEKYINAIQKDGVKIIEGGSTQAYYDCASDVIQMPARASFVLREMYWATLFHEIAHSTGNPKRLSRFKDYIPSKEKYSFEELVAEVASNIICDRIGINTANIRIRSASYLQGWMSYLKESPSTTIFKAVSAAERVVQYLDNLVAMQMQQAVHKSNFESKQDLTKKEVPTAAQGQKKDFGQNQNQNQEKKFGSTWKNFIPRFPKKN